MSFFCALCFMSLGCWWNTQYRRIHSHLSRGLFPRLRRQSHRASLNAACSRSYEDKTTDKVFDAAVVGRGGRPEATRANPTSSCSPVHEAPPANTCSAARVREGNRLVGWCRWRRPKRRATRAADVRVRRTPKSDELLFADARISPANTCNAARVPDGN